MCGILGVATVRGRALGVDARTLERMRDVMRHRGPDGSGLWVHEHVALAHRRLAVIDTSNAAAQPMVTADGRYAITYNGELYNDAELRAELAAEGVSFRTASDTETVLAALAVWGPAALARLRGMYALGLYDTVDRTLLIARDPLGIKPLYYALAGGGEELVFASEPRAVLAHPLLRAKPDMVSLSAYLTTIRTVMGTRTLFEGVRTLRPGQALMISLGGDRIESRPLPFEMRSAERRGERGGGAAAEEVREIVDDSVRRHLRSDVPICCLLSGGLDSSIVAEVANRELGALHTYCSGSPAGDGAGDDFAFARMVAERLGTRHTEVPIGRDMFAERWRGMVAAMGTPLSTPNEVAINAVARSLRSDGKIVTLSGEGADELFGGYESVALAAGEFEGVWREGHGRGRAEPHVPRQHGGHHQLHANAWAPLDAKPALLRPEVWRAVEQDSALLEFYRVEFETALAQRPAGGGNGRDPLERLQAHLVFQRRINLAGLLQRLDTAMMLEGVEGRTPFADVLVCEAAESLPVAERIGVTTDGPEHRVRLETKRVLRRAFAERLPREVVERPKASFPLPFQAWMADSAAVLRESAFARQVFTDAAIEMVSANPAGLWRFAWPMVNVAMWGKAWWG